MYSDKNMFGDHATYLQSSSPEITVISGKSDLKLLKYYSSLKQFNILRDFKQSLFELILPTNDNHGKKFYHAWQ